MLMEKDCKRKSGRLNINSIKVSCHKQFYKWSYGESGFEQMGNVLFSTITCFIKS